VVVKASRDEVRGNVFSATGSNNLVNSVFNDGEFTSVKDHADVGVREVKFLISRSAPWELTQLTDFHIS
jgi:hypothetical protein